MKKLIAGLCAGGLALALLGCGGGDKAKPTGKPGDTTKPATTKPADTKPADTKPADTKPADTKPAETKPADPK